MSEVLAKGLWFSLALGAQLYIDLGRRQLAGPHHQSKLAHGLFGLAPQTIISSWKPSEVREPGGLALLEAALSPQV